MMRQAVRVFNVVILVWLLVSCGADTTTEGYVTNARQHLNDGEVSAAVIELKNALRKDAAHGEARWLLGKTYFELGDMASADKELRRALQLGISEDQVVPLLAQAFLALAKHDELQALLVEQLPSSDSRGVVLAAQGLGQLAKGQREASAQRIARALDEAGGLAYVQMAKAFLLSAESDLNAIREQLDEVFKIDPDYAPALSLLGDLDARERKLDAADAAYGRAIDARPDSFEDRVKRVLVSIELQKYDVAQDEVTKLLAKAPKHPGVNYAQGLIYFHEKKLPEAQTAFEQALVAKSRYPQALYYSAAVHLALGNRQQAEAYAGDFYNLAPGNVAARKLLGVVKLAGEDYARVEELVRPVIAAVPEDVDAMNLLAATLLRQGKTDEGIELLTKVAELQPDSPVAQMRLGAGMLAGGEQTGVQYIESALSLNPDYEQADILLVLNFLRENDIGRALSSAQAFRDRQPDIATPYNLLGRVYSAAKNDKKARESFEKARSIAPGDPFASQSLAQLALRESNYDLADGYYQEILKHHQDNLPALLKLSVLEEARGDSKAMVAYLERAIGAHPTAPQPRLILARYYLAKNRADKVPVLLSGLNDEDKQSPGGLLVAGMSQLAEQDYRAATASFEKLVVLQPEAANVRYLLAQAYDGGGTGKDERVEAELRKAIELVPAYIEPHLALARLLLKQGRNEAFDKQLAHVDALAPENPGVWLLQIAQAQAKGDAGAVLAIHEKAYEKLPSTSTVLGLARQKLAMGDADGAISLQTGWLRNNPEDVAVYVALADVYINTNNAQLAIDQYINALKYAPDNLVVLNNLAWFLRDVEPEKSVRYALQAAKIDGESPDVQDTLALALLANGQLTEAKEAIARALAKTPDNASMRYHRALIQTASGQKSNAISELNTVLRGSDDFQERSEAEALLKKLKAGG